LNTLAVSNAANERNADSAGNSATADNAFKGNEQQPGFLPFCLRLPGDSSKGLAGVSNAELDFSAKTYL
jgi:hypothetical protein